MQNLNHGSNLYRRISKLEKRILGINESLYNLQGTDYEKDVVTTSRKDNYRTETLMDEKKKFEEEIAELNNEISDFFENLISVVEKIEKEEYRKILKYRYIHFYDWNLISRVLGISESYVFQLHRKAKKEYYNLIK